MNDAGVMGSVVHPIVRMPDTRPALQAARVERILGSASQGEIQTSVPLCLCASVAVACAFTGPGEFRHGLL